MTILVATDFSPSAWTAVRLGAALARRQSARLHIVHAFNPTFDPLSLPSGGSWEAEMLSAAEAQMAGTANELRQTGIAVTTEVTVGSPVTLIIQTARANDAALIVVGTHGRRGAAHLFLGSVAERVVHTAPCPVLVTRADSPSLDRWTSAGTPLDMTIVTDGNAATDVCAYWLGTIGRPLRGATSLLRVYWPPQEAGHYGVEQVWQGDDGHPELLRLLERDLRHHAQALEGATPPTVRCRVAYRDVSPALARDARELGADAMVVAVPKHHAGRASAMDLGALLRAAPVPVFCVPESIHPGARHIPRITSVLFACDLSDSARAAILPAYGLLPGGGRVEICYVHEQGSRALDASALPTPPLDERERATLKAKLRALVPPEAAEQGISTHVSVAEGRIASEAILAAAERLDVDVIALGSHGRSGLRRVILGSVAEAVARDASRPVLIAHAAQQL